VIGSGTAGMVGTLACLLLLLGLLAAGLYFMRHGLDSVLQRKKGPRKLVVSESRMVGNRQFLIVAEYEGKKMLLGISPGRIDYLCNLGDEPDGDRFSSMLPETPQ
jgi:flagellar protein FliO/FliZ